MTDLATLDDGALIDALQRAAFAYFAKLADPVNGLVPDTSRKGSPCSIACVGFALSCYPVGVERGWMRRTDAAALTLAALRFFHESPQGDASDDTGHKGFYYHFLDMKTGRRVWDCELSSIDTTLLLAGVLMAAAYFTGSDAAEAEIRDLADRLTRRVDWPWAQDGAPTISQGWRPETGFLQDEWEGFNEALLLFILGLGSPTFPLPPESYGTWTRTYQWESIYGIDTLYAGSLFIHLFPQAWIDFRGVRDAFMREKRCDYFENTRRAIAMQREYCRRNPYGYQAYSADFWGITAGDGPRPEDVADPSPSHGVFGYTGRGVPFGPDDGTISPWAMPATLPYEPAAALSGTRNLLAHHPRAVPRGRFSSGFNPSVAKNGKAWLSDGLYGLDQGLLVLSMENYRSGLPWRLMRSCAVIRDGLERAGFEGGWLAGPPDGGGPHGGGPPC